MDALESRTAFWRASKCTVHQNYEQEYNLKVLSRVFNWFYSIAYVHQNFYINSTWWWAKTLARKSKNDSVIYISAQTFLRSHSLEISVFKMSQRQINDLWSHWTTHKLLKNSNKNILVKIRWSWFTSVIADQKHRIFKLMILVK